MILIDRHGIEVSLGYRDVDRYIHVYVSIQAGIWMVYGGWCMVDGKMEEGLGRGGRGGGWRMKAGDEGGWQGMIEDGHLERSRSEFKVDDDDDDDEQEEQEEHGDHDG